MYFRINVSLGGAMAMVLSVAAPAATPITYIGSQQVGSILADYSFVTDGTLGTIGADHVLSYSVTLADSLSSYTFGTATGARPISNFLVASASSLSPLNNGQPLILAQNPPTPGVLPGSLSFLQNFTNLSVSAQISDAFGTRTTGGTFTNPIATAVVVPPSAVPEPAAWEMVIVGFGAIGGAMRRRQRIARVAFA